ncbi:hypothetical protein N7508_000863 [Penicillium antarcticum]|uniref:uncharacterized protein n=1 Tax=Penicillium antarcticum TaxID=416450 RepID=UPI0023968FF8|nr:uncharacterized protein N7508_000863 [Penicillium antarcticum]KAJ5320580.1 hypothetical protein N7508_000863 [Penicillium antarcticum]
MSHTSLKSGNYDFPPASPSSSRVSGQTGSTERGPDVLRLQHLRNLVNERNRSGAYNTFSATRALLTLNQEILEHTLDRARDRTDFEQARAAADRQIQQLQSEIASPPDLIRSIWADQINLNSERSLSPLAPEAQSLRRRLPRPAYISPSPDGSSSRSPSLMPPGSSGRDGQGRLKRRKLDADDNREEFQGFNYGRYGQVYPGRLQMEIASCDGGNYDPDGGCSRPDNVLENNQSVYSTKENRCNLILRHRGEAPFCLKKIVIKAPQCGFDAPIQEGMVFVSMSSDELLDRTARYQIQYSSPRWRRRHRRHGLQPSQEYLNAYRSPLQNLERTVLMGPNSDSSASDTTDDPQRQFRITTEYDENNEENSHSGNDDTIPFTEFERAQGDQSDQGDRLEDPSTETDETPTEDEDDNTRTLRQRIQSNRRQNMLFRMAEQSERRNPTLVNPNPPPEPNSPEVLKPHARFFIERQKSMVTIKFDPPPSGRFILIKLWSPRPDGNIDIESIITHGYAGPRFFPSIAPR